MTLRSYVWGIRLVTLLSLTALVAVLKFVDPDSTGMGGKMLFYFSLFFTLSGIFNLLLLWLRKKLMDPDTVSFSIGLSFRQGNLLSLFAIGLLVMQSLRILVWWDGALLLAGIFIIELYFVSKS
jgi:hypothetical protein